MNKLPLILFLVMLLVPSALWADVVHLKSGSVLPCTVLFENDDVVMVRDSNGARFQYPKADVVKIVRGESAPEQQSAEVMVEKESNQPAKVLVGIEVLGGLAAGMEPARMYSGGMGADVVIGSRRINGRDVQLGGSIGYMFCGGTHFLPIQVAMRIPLLEGKHSPLVSANMGYGVGLRGVEKGGLHAGAGLWYVCRLNERSRVMVGLCAEWQQAELLAHEEVDGTVYVGKQGRNMVNAGLKAAICF